MAEAVKRSERSVRSPHSELFGAWHLGRRSRCCVIAAHPNDEIVGSGCLISKLPKVKVLHISDGAPRTREEALAGGHETPAQYAEARRRECLTALELAHIPADRVFEFGLAQFEASFQMAELARHLLAFLQKNAAQIVLTHAYEGGHPDHDAVAFATHAAVHLMSESGLRPPVVFEMALYPGKNGMSKVPMFLHHPSRESTTLILDHRAQELKQRMFECCKTQQQIFADSPLGPEQFRQAPDYDFRAPPHRGKLHYENFDWGVTGKEWRERASVALKELFLFRSAKLRHHTSHANYRNVQSLNFV